MKIINPDSVIKPMSKYAQGVVHAVGGERIVVSGQLGVLPDGTVEDGLEAQMERAWTNVLNVMADAGFDVTHMTKATIYVTMPGQVLVYRKVRDKMLNGHLCANTYLEIAGLAGPDFLVEIEAEAVKD